MESTSSRHSFIRKVLIGSNVQYFVSIIRMIFNVVL